MPVISIASLDDIMQLLDEDATFAQYQAAVSAYRNKYGIAA
jgi:orotate phosphoribosyltransferase